MNVLLSLLFINTWGLIAIVAVLLAIIFVFFIVLIKYVVRIKIAKILEHLAVADLKGLKQEKALSGVDDSLIKDFISKISYSEVSFKEFVDTLPEVVFEVDTEGNLLYVNDKAFELFEYNPEDFKKGISLFEFVDKDHIDKVQSNIQKLFTGEKSESVEYKLVTALGNKFYAEIYIKPIYKDGEINRLRGLIVDSTDRHKYIEDIRVYSDIIKHMQLGFMVFEMSNPDDDGSFVLIDYNQAAVDLIYPDNSYVDERKIDEVLPFFRSQGLPEILKDVIKESGKYEIQSFIYQLSPESDITYLNLKIFAISNNRLVLFFEDISESKKAEELKRSIEVTKQSAALKQQFLANMSHEIRTPMTGIMGMLSLLLRTDLDDVQSEYVKSIKISSENLLNIINDVLDLSKIEAGKMELKPVSVNIKKLCDQFQDLYFAEARKNSLDFICSVDPNLPVSVIVDENRLRQIINNLLSNAFKFTDEGSVSLTFKINEKHDNYMSILCEITDTGVGITKKNQNKIFSKFTQIESSFTLPFEGTGLGLAICKELTRLMGGQIHVKSKIGEGSVFSFTFKAGYDASVEDNKHVVENNKSNKLGLRVLLVEDRALNRKVARLMLENAGCDVFEVVNGEEAVTEFKPGKFDVILMDIQMPVMDGITALNNLKKLYNDIPPVIALSANAMEGDEDKFIALGMSDYLSKPFKFENLYEKLAKWGAK
ncbi:MAG: response regulator [Bacteroidota bacterium]